MSNELYRINAVKRFMQPNAAITKDLNDIVTLAAQICETPVALITLLDEDTQWFKASKGVDIDCTARELSFCNYTIQQNDINIITDTLLDERFISNPLVIAEPFIRFYAGCSLVTNDGHAIGALCIVDFKPRDITETQQNTLRILSKQVMNLLELNYALRAKEQHQAETEKQKALIAESELKLNAIFDSTKDCHILIDKDRNIIAYNRASDLFVQKVYDKSLQNGVSILEYFDEDVKEDFAKYFHKAFNGEALKFEWHMRPDTEQPIWKELEFVPIKNSANQVVSVALNSADITDRKIQEDQINIQNAALTRIAIIQSHELRRPVASLLGIMALLKLEQKNADLDYFDILEHTVNELDAKIREIVKDSESTISNQLAIVA
ncbi:GAF domain-containing protein [Mucilaginibacter sp. dw_454]|uniref:GAF domain-containing protein n=1 Tax=Mucilaginibacter sp. dw_454 TaxID=2720079 RepID=UPI001BD63C12|nr:GAF domain-containing protein [Mucilaginibacter sp. dw_454]